MGQGTIPVVQNGSWTGRGTLVEIRDESRDPRRGQGLVGGLLGWSWTVWGPCGGGPGWVGGTSLWSRTGRGTLGEFWGKFREDRDGSGDRQGSPGQVWGPSGRSKTGGKTLGEDREGSGNLGKIRDGLGYPRECLGRVGGPSLRSGTGCLTVGEIRDGSVNHRGGPGWVGKMSGRSGTG